MGEQKNCSFTVREEHAGKRLDALIPVYLPELSRSRASQLIAEGRVHLSGSVATSASAKCKEGAEVSITIPELAPIDLAPEAIPLSIIYEDADLLVIDKAVGMAVHPAPGHWTGTLVHALLHHCRGSLSGMGGEERPGIVHRLDKDTSGVMIVAKHDEAHRKLAAQLADRTLSRIYETLVWGAPNPSHGIIDTQIARSPQNRKKMAVVKSGKQAITHYKTLHRFVVGGNPLASRVECQLKTGRTHQIRVHLTHKGCSLVGDPLYGGSATPRLRSKTIPEVLKESLAQFPRQCLHAREISFIHPRTGEQKTFSAPLPADMENLYDALYGAESSR